MNIYVNMDKLNEKALKDIGDKLSPDPVLPAYNKEWLIAAEMTSHEQLAAYPISSINPLAPPTFYIVGKEVGHGVHNKAPVHTIVKALSKYCKAKDLDIAAKRLKKAVMVVSR